MCPEECALRLGVFLIAFDGDQVVALMILLGLLLKAYDLVDPRAKAEASEFQAASSRFGVSKMEVLSCAKKQEGTTCNLTEKPKLPALMSRPARC